jgi:signal transduction histidine kinase
MGRLKPLSWLWLTLGVLTFLIAALPVMLAPGSLSSGVYWLPLTFSAAFFAVWYAYTFSRAALSWWLNCLGVLAVTRFVIFAFEDRWAAPAIWAAMLTMAIMVYNSERWRAE